MRLALVIAMLIPLPAIGCSRDEREPAGGGSRPVPVLLAPAASREGLPEPPRVVRNSGDNERLRRADAAYIERTDGVARALVPELRRLGARDVTTRRFHGEQLHVRALVPRRLIPSLEARADVARVAQLVRHTGRVERRDLAFILETDDGRRYELRGLLGKGDQLDGARIEVEGEEWRGAVAPPPASRSPTFIVFDWRRLG